MVLMACGITFFGSFASAAVTPIISTPPKANITMPSEAITPCQPLGAKPPWLQRFSSPVAGKLWPKPKKMIPAPASIMAIIATTFTRDSQNSISPNTRTLHRFIAPIKKMMLRIQIQRGTSGYHNPI